MFDVVFYLCYATCNITGSVQGFNPSHKSKVSLKLLPPHLSEANESIQATTVPVDNQALCGYMASLSYTELIQNSQCCILIIFLNQICIINKKSAVKDVFILGYL